MDRKMIKIIVITRGLGNRKAVERSLPEGVDISFYPSSTDPMRDVYWYTRNLKGSVAVIVDEEENYCEIVSRYCRKYAEKIIFTPREQASEEEILQAIINLLNEHNM